MTQPFYNYQPNQTNSAPPKRKPSWIAPGVALAVSIVVGSLAVLAIVLLKTSGETAAKPVITVTAPAPAPSTVTAPPPAAREVTPAICRKALSDADHLVSVMSDGYQIAAEGFGAVADGDAAGVERATEKLTELKPKLNKALDRYNQSKTECNNH
jgi:hypothetical protein